MSPEQGLTQWRKLKSLVEPGSRGLLGTSQLRWACRALPVTWRIDTKSELAGARAPCTGRRVCVILKLL